MISPALLKRQLVYAIQEHGTLHGEFTLSSGQQSDRFYDVQRAVLSQPGFDACGNLLRDICFNLDVDAIGGPASGAIAPACTVIALTELRGFYIKQHVGPVFHGPKGDISGVIRSSDRILVVEDVVTSGATLQWAIDHLADVEAATVAGAVGVLDRSGKDLEFTVPYTSLVTLKDLASPTS